MFTSVSLSRAWLFAFALGSLISPVLSSGIAMAQDTIKIGLILSYTGQFADTAIQMDNAIKLFVKEHGDTVAGKKVEFIRKDTGGIAPDVAKRLAQELVTRDRVDVLAGFALTPNAMAAADVSAQAKKFMVVMNAATSVITTKSDFLARTSFTTAQSNESLGKWAYQSGIRKVYTGVSDFGPGHDAEQAFQSAFKQAGGEIVGSLRWPPNNTDFSPFVQRMKDSGAEAIFLWIPGGAQPSALGKALAERGIQATKSPVMGQETLTDENAIKGMGEVAVGMITASHYDFALNNPKNKAFVDAYRKDYGRMPDIFSIGAYDGMQLIYDVLKKTKGNTDGAALIDAAKGMSWESPRGPISIDPETRDIIQNIYIRRVEKVGDELKNVDFYTFKDVKDPVKAQQKK
jgi:branched-chain amino acid transport system substrate-binding protein